MTGRRLGEWKEVMGFFLHIFVKSYLRICFGELGWGGGSAWLEIVFVGERFGTMKGDT